MSIFKDFYLNVQLLSEEFPQAKIPTRGTKESAGLDFYTPIDITIQPNKDILVPLGIKLEMPAGYALVFLEKSGIATKKKLTVGAKVVDSDYRNIPHAHLINNSDETVTFTAGDKVVQGIITPVWLGDALKVESVNENTERGLGGFGSTGDR